jgi:HSP20 family protein
MRIRRGDLLQDIDVVQREMERLFTDMWGRHTPGMYCPQETWRPPTDVYEVASGLVVKMELSGMRDGDVDVVVDEKTLLVSGFRPENRPHERMSYYQMGVNYGHFCLQIFLPWPVDENAVTATYEDGFLVIQLPRRTNDRETGRRIDIPIQENAERSE